jgi:hypothetical protein
MLECGLLGTKEEGKDVKKEDILIKFNSTYCCLILINFIQKII